MWHQPCNFCKIQIAFHWKLQKCPIKSKRKKDDMSAVSAQVQEQKISLFSTSIIYKYIYINVISNNKVQCVTAGRRVWG